MSFILYLLNFCVTLCSFYYCKLNSRQINTCLLILINIVLYYICKLC